MSALEDAVEDLKKRFRREARDRRLSDGLRRSARAALGALCMAQVVGCGGAPFEAGIIDTDAGAEKDGARGPSDSYGDPPPVDAGGADAGADGCTPFEPAILCGAVLCRGFCYEHQSNELTPDASVCGPLGGCGAASVCAESYNCTGLRQTCIGPTTACEDTEAGPILSPEP